MALPSGLSFVEPVADKAHLRPSSRETETPRPLSTHSTIVSEPPTPVVPESRDELLSPPQAAPIAMEEIERRVSHRSRSAQRQPQEQLEVGPDDQFTSGTTFQGVPSELGSLLAEVIFVLIASTGQLFFSFLLGNVTVNQFKFAAALDIKYSQTPWLVGAFLLANGLSVVVSGSLSDLSGPKPLMTGAFAWLTLWNVVACFSIRPSLKILFFVVRAMQGLAVGVLVSASMSILGRIYKPGLRKTRVFSAMAAMAPMGFWAGAMQGGAFSAHLPWVFGFSAILSALCCIAGWVVIPPLAPARDTQNSNPPSMRNFDYLGALCAISGCACILFGLTQGSAVNWPVYTYVVLVIGFLIMIAFFFVERRAARPIIPNRLWKAPGFLPLIGCYFLGFGAYIGAWQFYAVQWFLLYQNATPLKVALYILPNAIVGVLATLIVSRTLHMVPGHWIMTASMIAFAMGPVFFLPQSRGTSYWALSMPGIALVTFGPDLSFAAASIFITSSVPRSYQGSAGSLLVTVQNLSAAVLTSVSDSIGTRVQSTENGEIGIDGIRAIWWFALGVSLASALLCATTVRIAKSEEKEHSH